MREILFRGKTDNKWVYGVPIYLRKEAYIVRDFCLGGSYTDDWVEEESVGQFTGLTDKNGVKIFEGDIVIFNRGRNLPNTNPRPRAVFFDERNVQFTMYASPYATLQKDMMSECEVIGNIHDNPELLED